MESVSLNEQSFLHQAREMNLMISLEYESPEKGVHFTQPDHMWIEQGENMISIDLCEGRSNPNFVELRHSLVSD